MKKSPFIIRNRENFSTFPVHGINLFQKNGYLVVVVVGFDNFMNDSAYVCVCVQKKIPIFFNFTKLFLIIQTGEKSEMENLKSNEINMMELSFHFYFFILKFFSFIFSLQKKKISVLFEKSRNNSIFITINR